MKLHTTITAALTASTIFTSAAFAGGFDRGGVNIDQLFDAERYTFDTAVTFVNPQRTIRNVRRDANVAAPALIQGGTQQQIARLIATPGNGINSPADISPATLAAIRAGVAQAVAARGTATSASIDVDSSYTVPRVGIKAGFGDNVACLASYTEPFGATAGYGLNNAYSPTSVNFEIDTRDYGLTCSYRFAAGEFSVGQGYIRAIAGVSYQELEGFQSRQTFQDFATAGLTAIPGTGVTNTLGVGTFDVDGDAFGYRLGVAYEIPEIALRAALIYHSRYDYDLDGIQDNSGFGAVIPGVFDVRRNPITLSTEIPQAVEVRLQTGLNEKTLAFANFKWQEWSKLDVIPIIGGRTPVSGQPTNLSFDPRYDDGYTLSGGIGRRLTDDVSALVGIGWDRGTSTVTGTQTDTYTLSAGLAITPIDHLTINVGGLIGRLTDGNSDLPPLTGGDAANNLTYEFSDDTVYALSIGAKLKF